MTTWMEIAGRSEPVIGQVDEFDKAKRAWGDAADRAETLKGEFRNIVSGDQFIGVQGEAAVAFRSVVEEMQHVLDDVPQVCRDLSTLLSGHAAKLGELRAQAASALARASAAWTDKHQAAAQRNQHDSRAAALRGQIQQLRAQPPEQSASQITTLESELRSVESQRTAAAGRASGAQSKIDTELRNWDQYRADEEQLNRATAFVLDHFDLRSLGNPGLIQQGLDKVGGYIGGWIDDIGHLIDGLVKGLIEGEWGDFLWALRDVLDRVMDVLMVIGVVLFVVGTFLTGGALLAALPMIFAVVSWVSFGVAAVNMAAGLMLMKWDSVNPQTGERMTWGDVALDAISVGFSVGGLRSIGALRNGANFTSLNAKRQILKKNAGLSFTKYSPSGTSVISKTGTAAARRSWVIDQARDHAIERGAEAVLSPSTPVTDPRLGTIQQGIDDLRRQQRGLSGGVEPVLVPAY